MSSISKFFNNKDLFIAHDSIKTTPECGLSKKFKQEIIGIIFENLSPNDQDTFYTVSKSCAAWVAKTCTDIFLASRVDIEKVISDLTQEGTSVKIKNLMDRLFDEMWFEVLALPEGLDFLSSIKVTQRSGWLCAKKYSLIKNYISAHKVVLQEVFDQSLVFAFYDPFFSYHYNKKIALPEHKSFKEKALAIRKFHDTAKSEDLESNYGHSYSKYPYFNAVFGPGLPSDSKYSYWVLTKEIIELIKKLGPKGIQSLDINGSAKAIHPFFGTLDLLNNLFLRPGPRLSLNTIFIPKRLENLKSLKLLYIINIQMYELPKSIGKLQALESIMAKKCQLYSVPREFSHLTGLDTLDLPENNISNLPESLASLHPGYASRSTFPQLKRVGFFGNPILAQKPPLTKACELMQKINQKLLEESKKEKSDIGSLPVNEIISEKELSELFLLLNMYGPKEPKKGASNSVSMTTQMVDEDHKSNSSSLPTQMVDENHESSSSSVSTKKQKTEYKY